MPLSSAQLQQLQWEPEANGVPTIAAQVSYLLRSISVHT